MAFKYVGNVNKEIQYICKSTDTKEDVDIGARLLESDTGKHLIFDSDSTWTEYFDPKLSTST